jgi:peptidoglycan/xylan/chitin deacetylase (PgdA/CDA1 family)
VKVCVSIDMDNYRDYQRLVDPGGDPGDRSFYDDAVPRFLDLFDRCGMRATFFMIGIDADSPGNRARVREIVARGHEVGNHSHTHPYNFRSLTRAQKVAEIEQADAAIADTAGVRPVGFRTPSMDVDPETIEIVAERGYLYDSSIFPGPFMWLFMLYGKLFVRHADYALGSLLTPVAPSQPYVPDARRLNRRAAPTPTGVSSIVEIPVSLAPYSGLPFYGTLMRRLGTRVFDLGVRATRNRRPVLHYLLHLLDLAQIDGSSLEAGIRSSPGLGLSFERREAFTAHVMEQLSQLGEAVPMREVAQAFRQERGMV